MSNVDGDDDALLTNGVKGIDVNNEGEDDDADVLALDKELDALDKELDKMENWSGALHAKVADLLKETRQQNQSCKEENQSKESKEDTEQEKEIEK